MYGGDEKVFSNWASADLYAPGGRFKNLASEICTITQSKDWKLAIRAVLAHEWLASPLRFHRQIFNIVFESGMYFATQMRSLSLSLFELKQMVCVQYNNSNADIWSFGVVYRLIDSVHDCCQFFHPTWFVFACVGGGTFLSFFHRVRGGWVPSRRSCVELLVVRVLDILLYEHRHQVVRNCVNFFLNSKQRNGDSCAKCQSTGALRPWSRGG